MYIFLSQYESLKSLWCQLTTEHSGEHCPTMSGLTQRSLCKRKQRLSRKQRRNQRMSRLRGQGTNFEALVHYLARSKSRCCGLPQHWKGDMCNLPILIMLQVSLVQIKYWRFSSLRKSSTFSPEMSDNTPWGNGFLVCRYPFNIYHPNAKFAPGTSNELSHKCSSLMWPFLGCRLIYPQPLSVGYILCYLASPWLHRESQSCRWEPVYSIWILYDSLSFFLTIVYE